MALVVSLQHRGGLPGRPRVPWVPGRREATLKETKRKRMRKRKMKRREERTKGTRGAGT